MNVPLPARIAALVLATTAFYTWVGQLVPQKEVQAPQETVLQTDMTTADMAKVGREIMEGKGLCMTCHTIGKSGALRFPDLDGIGVRAGSRVPGMSDIEYLAQSMYAPDSYIVEGFNPGMPAINKPPIGLTDQEILTVIAALLARRDVSQDRNRNDAHVERNHGGGNRGSESEPEEDVAPYQPGDGPQQQVDPADAQQPEHDDYGEDDQNVHRAPPPSSPGPAPFLGIFRGCGSPGSADGAGAAGGAPPGGV